MRERSTVTRLPPITLHSARIDRFGPVLRIRLTMKECGWLHAYLDNDTQLLAITSDWGDWAYRWDGKNGWHDVFVLDRKPGPHAWSYITDKLYGGRSDREEWDEERTKSHVRQSLAVAYRCGEHDVSWRADDYREAIREVAEASSSEELMHYAEHVSMFGGVDYIYMRESFRFLQLRDQLLPMLGEAWRKWQDAMIAEVSDV